MPEPIEEPKVEPTEEPKQEEKKFTREQLASAVNAQIKKFKDEELPELLKSSYSKGVEEAKMNADELAKKKADEEKAELEQRLSELNKREQLISVKEQLSQSELPTGIANKIVPALTAIKEDDRAGFIADIKTAIQEAAHQEVIEKTKGKTTPKTGGATTDVDMTKEKWNSLGYSEQVKLYRSNPEEYTKFFS